MNKYLRTLIGSLACLMLLPQVSHAQLALPGINLGNTLESTWGYPAPTQALINSMHNAGFKTLRVPCAWYYNSTNGVINSSYMTQVTNVVNWALADGMYVVINDHWDTGWFSSADFTSYNSSLNSELINMWTQISNNFKNTSNTQLLFACTNEPNASTQAQQNVLFEYYQNWITAIRATGGNNASRWLVLQPGACSIDYASEWITSMPSDPANHLMLECHDYDPYQFTLMSSDQSWGNMFYFWGAAYHSSTLTNRNATWGEESYISSELAKAQAFVKNGIPVLMGEYRAEVKPSESDLTGSNITLNYDSCTYWDKYFENSCAQDGLYATAWVTPGDLFNWTTGAVVDQTQINACLGISCVPPPDRGGNLIANGTYSIVGVQSGKGLDDPAWSGANGTQMDIWTLSGGANQNWTLSNLGNNVVELVNGSSGLALSVSGGSTSNGAAVVQTFYTGAASQQWTVSQVSSGVYILKNVNSGELLDVYGAKTANGTLIDQWPSNGGTNQEWKFE